MAVATASRMLDEGREKIMSEHHWGDRIHLVIKQARESFHDLLAKDVSPYEQFGEDWPSADGIVEWAQAGFVNHGTSSYWVGELAYSYHTEGEYYAGVYHLAVSSEAEANAVVQGWKGRKVVVRYSPQDFSVSVMQPWSVQDPVPSA
jgi:hypothetical protein